MMICSSPDSSPLAVIVMREKSPVAPGDTTRLSMLNPRRENACAMRTSAPGRLAT